MTAEGYVALGISVLLLLFGNGILNKVLLGALREEFRETFATTDHVNRVEKEVEKVNNKTHRLFEKQDQHHDKLVRLEDVTRNGGVLERMLIRLDRMDDQNRQRDLLVNNTVNTLSAVADTLEKLQERFDNKFTSSN